jgi:hypothetical protein
MSSTDSTKGYLKRQSGKSLFFKAAFFVLATCFIFNTDLQAQTFGDDNGKRPFDVLSAHNITGDILIFGNTILGKGGSCPGDDENNNYIPVTSYWDVDGDSSTFSSSSSELKLPAGSTVKEAFIYWQGRSTVSGVNNHYDNASNIKLKVPGATKYQVINATVMNWAKEAKGSISYQGTHNITDIVKAAGAGNYIVADLFTERNNANTDSGSYGAWAIVVVYENNAESLKNITIFDGYNFIVPVGPHTDFPLKGFLTPRSGAIASKFLIFAGEGDTDYHGDDITVNGITLLRDDITDGYKGDKRYKNVLRSYIKENGHNVVSRNPQCQNNIGIDIQTFDIGTTGQNLIHHNDTSANISLFTHDDVYYPSVFAFSTQLYTPDVCYYIDTIVDDSNTTVFSGGKFTAPLNKNKEYQFNVWISNMNENAIEPLEAAENVIVNTQFTNPTTFDYVSGSTWIRNVGPSPRLIAPDPTGIGLGDHVGDTSIWRVGAGAGISEGGTLYPTTNFNNDSAKAFIDFKVNIGDINGTNFNLMDYLDFKASFKIPVLDIEIPKNAPMPIKQCRDLNTTFSAPINPVGNFTVVNQNFNKLKLDVENHDEYNALYTQIANKQFDAVLVSLGDYVAGSTTEKEVVPFNPGDNTTYKVYAIQALDCPTSSGNCTEAEKAEKCKNATIINTVAEGNFLLSNNGTILLDNINVTAVSKKASFKVVLNDDNETSSCSIDNFAIRPATFVFLDTNYDVKLTGGHYYDNGMAKAIDSNNTVTIGYNQLENQISHYNSTLTDYDLPANCTLDGNVTTELSVGNTDFINGVGNITVQYNNIGTVIIGFEDHKWASVDGGDHGGAYDDCIPNSVNTHTSNGKLGCYIAVKKSIKFIPAEFGNELSIYDFKNDFTYISDSYEMTAFMNLWFTALLEGGAPATNYHQYCYAKDINYTIALIEDKPEDWLASGWANASEQILFHINATNATHNSSNVTYDANATAFNNGTAILTQRFGFDKNLLITQNPFISNNTDFNITIVRDTDGVRGDDFYRGDISNATFYYGRVICSQSTYTVAAPVTNITTPINYEIYCGLGCNSTKYGVSQKSPTGGKSWYVHTQHSDVDFGYVANYLLTTPITTIKPDHFTTNNLINGSETNTFTNVLPQYPLTDTVTMLTQSWLHYGSGTINRECRLVFTGGSGKWAGEGKVSDTDKLGRVVETDALETGTAVKPKIDW